MKFDKNDIKNVGSLNTLFNIHLMKKKNILDMKEAVSLLKDDELFIISKSKDSDYGLYVHSEVKHSYGIAPSKKWFFEYTLPDYMTPSKEKPDFMPNIIIIADKDENAEFHDYFTYKGYSKPITMKLDELLALCEEIYTENRDIEYEKEKEAEEFIEDLFDYRDYELIQEEIEGIISYFDGLTIDDEEFIEKLQNVVSDIEQLNKVKEQINKFLRDKK